MWCNTNRVRRYEFSPDAKAYTGNPWVEVDLFSEEANGIAIRSKALGNGAERLVFGLQVCVCTNDLFDSNSERNQAQDLPAEHLTRTYSCLLIKNLAGQVGVIRVSLFVFFSDRVVSRLE